MSRVSSDRSVCTDIRTITGTMVCEAFLPSASDNPRDNSPAEERFQGNTSILQIIIPFRFFIMLL
jgi:hypothetical protein